MQLPIHHRPGLLVLTPAFLALLWVGLGILLLLARGDLEALLRRDFGEHARPDAFDHLNGVSTAFWIAHTCLTVVAIAAARSRRTDVLVVLLIGPLIASGISLLGQSWSDPNWLVVAAVCTIGWLASTVVGATYWAFRPTARLNRGDG
ncbi:hypothetical protein [Paludisphaera rhizosphaerae]|uniref:hypothetical protein n=1 Tax=Paludisphaera rhizosphaerae TaxID=2711216 RepID=UPI0013EB3C6F|nr:hypothetical protein [Paludisphaera rhizosphaerae]